MKLEHKGKKFPALKFTVRHGFFILRDAVSIKPIQAVIFQ